jgi:hypothetical protein
MLVACLQLSGGASPTRLVLAVDGVAYRDLAALQAGVIHTNFLGWKTLRRAFTAEEGYYPVSRMISTFPSTSDVAWTDIFGDRPLPGYQRTYYSEAANEEVSINGVTTTMEHERQMDYQLQNGIFRALGYLHPVDTYRLEMFNALRAFRRTRSERSDFYVYLRSTDDAQHLDRDIMKLLCDLDQKLQRLRAAYRAENGRDLEIVLLSDHGHNHAGRGKRVEIEPFLKNLGYHVSKSIHGAEDVVLPTVGVESWVEIHNDQAVTEKLAQQLCHLEGVDIITACLPGQRNHFLVMNSRGERAIIEWRPQANSFRYVAGQGDPLAYLPVMASLQQSHQLDADGFATGDVWMKATLQHHYPLAMERIASGFLRNTLNPATILISLDHRYVHDSWLIDMGSRLVTCGSTHGGLDDLCSDGIVLSNFRPTDDTSSARVAAQFNDFVGVKDFRAGESGAEWITKREQARVRIQRRPLDRDLSRLPDRGIFLCAWSPSFLKMDGNISLHGVIEKAEPARPAHVGRGQVAPAPKKIQLEFSGPQLTMSGPSQERVYHWPNDLVLVPRVEYKLAGWLDGQSQAPLFTLYFATDSTGQPLVY